MSAFSASHQQPDKLMGILKSAKVNLRSVKNAFPIYKKHFWVLNFSAGRLEFYKNDQAPQAKGHVLGSQIRGVSFSGDRQNKFFDLCVQLRGGQERRFRMSSREERERWYKGIKSLAATFSTMNLFQSLVLAVHRRATQASNLSPFLIEVDLNALTEEHVQVTQYCLEAVDAGVEFARAIWRAMSNAAQLRAAAVLPDDSGDHSPSRVAAATAGAPEAPFQSVVLVVLVINTAQTRRALAGSMGSDETAGEDGSSDSTRYDPSTRQLTLTISVVKEADSNSETGEVVQIRHAEVDQAISMLQSDVWRNPFIEGWLTGDLRSNDTRREMAQYLGLTTEFVVTMQWGDNMDDVDRIQIEQYLERYVVSSTILDDVFLALREVASQQDPYEAQYGGGGGGPARSTALVAPFPTPREILRKYVVGVAVRLDRRTVQGDREPTLVLLHRMWNDRTMGGSIAVLSQWRSSQRQHRDDGPFTMLAQPISVNAHSAQAIRLMAQLNDVVLHARLSHAILTAEDTITHCLNCRDRCRADWEEYFRAMREDLGTPLPAGSLPWMVLRFLDVYIPRLQRAVTSLSQTPLTLLQQQKMLSPAVVPATPAPTAASRRGTTTRTFGGGGEPTEEFHHRDPSLLNGSNNVLDDVVLRCMSSLFIKFVSAGRRRQEDTASSHVPTLRNGILTDTVVLLNALRIRPDDIEREFDMAPISVLPASVVPLSVVYTVPVLSTWLRGYFVTPESLVVAPDRPHVPAMEDDDDSSGDDLEGGFGEAVASERKTETTILSVQNVVTILYDTQPNSERRLKIGVSVIRQAIEALDAAFPNEGRISKHNMLRILTINLSRLRELFATHVVSSVPELTHSSGDVTFDQEGTNLAVVPLPLAERLLRHYCEFEESERLVETLLERYYPATATNSTAEPGRAGSGGGVPSSQPPSQVREDLVPAAAASWPAYHRHRHSRRSDDTTTIPYETIAAVALTQLLPLEAKLAWTCRRDVVVVGLEGAGKSTLARLLRQTEAVPPSAQPQLPTIGMSESVVAYKEWVFLVKELGGRLDFRSNWKQYLSRLQRADALVFVVDAQSPALLSEASEFLHQIAPFSLFRGCPLLIIYNRYSDTKDRMANPNSRSRFQQQQQQQQRSSTTTTHSKTQARVEAFNDRMRLQDVSGSHEICSCVCPVLEAAPSLPSTSSSATPLLTRTNSTGGNVIHRRTGSSGGGGEIRGVPSLDEGFDWVCEQLRKKSERDSLPAPLKK